MKNIKHMQFELDELEKGIVQEFIKRRNECKTFSEYIRKIKEHYKNNHCNKK
jgi:hypothetical protein